MYTASDSFFFAFFKWTKNTENTATQSKTPKCMHSDTRKGGRIS